MKEEFATTLTGKPAYLNQYPSCHSATSEFKLFGQAQPLKIREAEAN